MATFTLEEVNTIGAEFDVICKANYGYEDSLTVGKAYKVTMVGRILPMSPLCEFIGDDGKVHRARVTRFLKQGEES